MKKILAGLILLTATFSVNADNAWGNYHWASTTTPIELQVIDSTTDAWRDILILSLSEWSMSNVIGVAVTSTDNKARVRKRCKAVTGKMRVCNAEYGNTGWLGLAGISIDSNSHIVSGYAKLNDTYSTVWEDAAFKNHVMCQEIGHVFGLGHTSIDGSSQETCMDYSRDLLSQWPNAHDYTQLELIYGHLDSYDTVDSGDAVDDDTGGGCNAPAGKGCNKIEPFGLLVSRTSVSEVWINRNNIGGYNITHIYLVDKH